jgi:methylated-DNA-[protein]-cysteine S-methyltransferase
MGYRRDLATQGIAAALLTDVGQPVGSPGPDAGRPMRDNGPMHWAQLPSQIDPVGVAVDDSGVCAVHFGGSPDWPMAPADTVPGSPDAPRPALLDDALALLERYFAGERTDFSVPLSVRRGSPFERAVWSALREIPYGQMRTYGEIAAAVGEPEAARAVGVACNRNPLPIIVPCHRVVGAGGKLVGFGGGLWRKKILLELEARVRIEHEFG